MAKRKKWQRSDSISIIALVLAIPAIVFSSIEFFENRNESIKIEKIDSGEKFWHISEITRTRKNLYVSEVFEWQKIRISNKSDFPITITNSFFKIDKELYKSSLKPYFEKIRYVDDKIELVNPIELPLKIEAQTVEELCFPLQIPVDSTMGMALLLTSFNVDNLSDSSSVTPIILHDNYFDEFINNFDSIMDGTRLKKKLGIDISMKSFNKINYCRQMMVETDKGYEFIDTQNHAADGFIFRNKGKCLVELNELLIKYDKPVQTGFSEIEICFKTLENNEYSFKYLSSDFWK
ncbi:hypothetical protein [Draconibacterium sediminis]|uniref:hypothetical protein n=1 Tax=Draconibacterium sediminis TaxID=1544798 RepID=UPI0026F339A8|nr:hypothetical protein [Draconibacterium sediminis]